MKRQKTRFTTIIIALALTLLLIPMACGSEPEPASQQAPPAADAPASSTDRPALRPTPVPIPTSARRLDLSSITTPTVEVRVAGQTADPTQPPMSTGNQRPTAPSQASPSVSQSADLVPDDPRNNEQVLLQDIYSRIDLSQYALDPNQPIPRGEKTYHDEYKPPPHTFPYSDTLHHPYLHIFPVLEHDLRDSEERGNDEVEYGGVPLPLRHERKDRGSYWGTTIKTGVSRFLLTPWYEPIAGHTLPDTIRLAKRTPPEAEIESHGYKHLAVGPHWFGHNSTRGVLADAVAQALRRAQLPNTRDMEFPPYSSNNWGEKLQVKPHPWSLEEHIRTPIHGKVAREDGQSRQPKAHQLPRTTWRFLSNDLPIIQVTTWSSTILPLTTEAKPFEINDEHETMKGMGTTHFAVSFVVAIQHRWASFEDPNRWLVRFQDDLRAHSHHYSEIPFIPEQGALTDENNTDFPNYWHFTDYMQHSIVGPVVVQVYESQVLEPGIYSITPRATHWAAPGPILSDEQLKIRGLVLRHLKEGEDPQGSYLAPPLRNLPEIFGRQFPKEDNRTVSEGRLALRHVPVSPNPGFPLPGHVMTDDATGPGSEIWERWALDAMGHEW